MALPEIKKDIRLDDVKYVPAQRVEDQLQQVAIFMADVDHNRIPESKMEELNGCCGLYDFIIDETHRWSQWAAPKKSDGTFVFVELF